ncbi:hypothetical protein T4E_6687 [Trichinella pseudospiralis]|uniref:PiggyBac transposable element-derived protein domain-containing protein n=1 Tax=Trichinella pseudospiralis TaxID=6337 RepID=A0A0V0XJW9_TRIPS|nr:hypothetical protein T4E_6687 [Trichinella pseudospiralis]
MRSRQPVNDETLASSKREDTDISNVALETDDSVVEDSNLDYETYSQMAADTAKDNGETVCLQCYKNDPRTNTAESTGPEIKPLEACGTLKMEEQFFQQSFQGSRHSKDELAVIWDTWIKNLPKTYNPSENVAVDDRLYPFKGRCQFRHLLFKVKLCMEYANLNWQAVKWNSREEPRHASRS